MKMLRDIKNLDDTKLLIKKVDQPNCPVFKSWLRNWPIKWQQFLWIKTISWTLWRPRMPSFTQTWYLSGYMQVDGVESKDDVSFSSLSAGQTRKTPFSINLNQWDPTGRYGWLGEFSDSILENKTIGVFPYLFRLKRFG